MKGQSPSKKPAPHWRVNQTVSHQMLSQVLSIDDKQRFLQDGYVVVPELLAQADAGLLKQVARMDRELASDRMSRLFFLLLQPLTTRVAVSISIRGRTRRCMVKSVSNLPCAE